MKRNRLLISTLTLFLLTVQPSLASLGVFPSPQNLDCDPVGTAWVSNLSLNSFDLHWTPVPNMTDYQIDVWVDNTPVYSTITQTTTTTITLPFPLQAGALVIYHIHTICDNGGISNPYRGEFPIIATEDVVMINPGGNQQTCNCPRSALPIQHSEELYMIYDCPCVQENQDSFMYKCPMTEGAIHITDCRIIKPPKSTSLTRFYPNPFSNQLQAIVDIPLAGIVSLSILDHHGREVRSVIKEEYFSTGPLTIEINTTELERGIYYYVFSLGTDRWFGRLIRL